MDKYFNSIKDILIKNGFTEVNEYKYSKDLCSVEISIDKNNTKNSFYIVDVGKGFMYSSSLDIYWLIGVLVYNGYIKNFEILLKS